MRLIVQSRQSASLGDAVDIKWLPRFMKHRDQVGPRHAVADAQAGESVNFRERAQDNNVPVVANELERVWRMIQELKIGFIENDNNIFRNTRHEAVDLALRNQRAGWI